MKLSGNIEPRHRRTLNISASGRKQSHMLALVSRDGVCDTREDAIRACNAEVIRCASLSRTGGLLFRNASRFAKPCIATISSSRRTGSSRVPLLFSAVRSAHDHYGFYAAIWLPPDAAKNVENLRRAVDSTIKRCGGSEKSNRSRKGKEGGSRQGLIAAGWFEGDV